MTQLGRFGRSESDTPQRAISSGFYSAQESPDLSGTKGVGSY